jgi:hypothetical protein
MRSKPTNCTNPARLATRKIDFLHSAHHADAIRSQDAAACGERAIVNRLWLCLSAVRPVYCSASELVVFVFEQDIEGGERSVTAPATAGKLNQTPEGVQTRFPTPFLSAHGNVR